MNGSSFAQITFERLYELYSDDSQGYSVVQNFDDGYIVAGSSGNNISKHKILIFRTDELGDTIWVRRFGDTIYNYFQAEAFSCLLSYDSAIVICGGNYDDVFLMKISLDGFVIWTKRIGSLDYNEIGYSVKQTFDSGFIVTGFRYPYSGSAWNAYLARTDKNGDTLWTRRYGESGYAYYGQDVLQTSDSGFLLVGYSQNSSTWISKILLVKTDHNGNLLWLKHFGGDDNDKRATSLAETNDYGYIITGSSPGQILLLRLNENGDSLWEKHLNNGYAESIKITHDQGYIITGGRQLIRTDSSGNILWSRGFAEEYAWAMEVNATNDSGFIIAGYTWSGYYIDRVYLVKTDENGLITGIGEPPEISSSIVFPNPCGEILIVKNCSDILSVSIVNIYSQFSLNVPYQNDGNEVRIDFSKFPPGLYSLIFETKEGRIVHKVVHL